MLMPKGKLIMCCGLRRSGSTWLFNVIRLSLMSALMPIESKFINTRQQDIAWAISPTKTTKVIKSHKFNKHTATAADKLFITHRDFRDVIASCMRRNLMGNQVTKDGGDTVNFNNVNEVKDFLSAEAYNYKEWSYYANMIIPYKRVCNDKLNLVSEILEHLGIITDPSLIIQKVNQLNIPTNVPDPVTQLRPNHITDGRTGNYSIVPKEILEMIEEEFDGFIQG